MTTKLATWVATVFVLLGGAALAAEEDFSKALAGLAAKSGATLHRAVVALAELDDPRALPALRALRDRTLRVDEEGGLWIEGREGELGSADGGERSPPSTGLGSPPINNRVRRAVQDAIARLELRSEDAGVRLAAAEELKKRMSPELLPVLEAALEREQDGRVRAVLEATLAQARLGSDDEQDRLRAIASIRESGDLGRRRDLEALLATGASGAFTEPSAEVRGAAELAIASLERKQILISTAANFFYGISLGSVLLLAALGLGITFGLMGVINMSHGEMIMLGAYATYAIQGVFQSAFPGAVDWYLIAAIPVAFATCTLAGMALERLVIRHLYGRPLETLLATWGTSLVMIQTVRLVFGAQNVEVANPFWLSGGVEVMHGVTLPFSRIAITVFVVLVVSSLALLLQRTSLGLDVRAVTQNRAMAACMGIPTRRIDLWTFGLGSGLAGLGGVALSQLGNVGPELGQQYIVDCFMVVVIGGVGNVAGTVLAALGLGIVNKLLEPMMGAVLGKIAVLLFIILFIQRRPQGLFALRGRSVEG